MRNILLGIIALFLAVLVIAALAYSDPLYLLEKNMRKYNDGEIVSESLVGYIPPAPASWAHNPKVGGSNPSSATILSGCN